MAATNSFLSRLPKTASTIQRRFLSSNVGRSASLLNIRSPVSRNNSFRNAALAGVVHAQTLGGNHRVDYQRQQWKSASAVAESSDEDLVIPTKHSWHNMTRQKWRKDSPICLDLGELEQLTKEFLETPVGHLYMYDTDNVDDNTTIEEEQEIAWQTAFNTIEKAEYLARGYNALVDGSLYSSPRNKKNDDSSTESVSNMTTSQAVTSLGRLLQRMEDEGNMYMEVRAQNNGLSSTEISSSSGISDEDVEDEPTATSPNHPFTPPGPTITLYDCLLDAMAVASERDSKTNYTPMDFYNVAAKVVERHYTGEDGVSFDEETIAKVENTLPGAIQPTQITYNAALRGVVATAGSPDEEQLRDEALRGGFGLYNHMTHDPSIPRNSNTIKYMLRLINKVFPTSRVKGNISVTLYDNACELGVVTKELVDDVMAIHKEPNGPEFEAFLEEIQNLDDQPQHHRRHLRKYHHSKRSRY